MDGRQQALDSRYTLLDELGRGGTAVVWRARDEVLGRSVAVKVLAGRHATDPGSRARIRAEARAVAVLSHPHIAQVYDYGEAEVAGACVPYVVMELIDGGTLQQRMTAGRLDPGFVFRIGGQVAAALAVAHAEGLVHRDIKPGNVMVTAAGAKVVDFGLAAAAGPAGPAEPAGEILGTPAYLAPERLTGGDVEPASDVYALGVLLYRLLTGASPWTVDSTTQMLSAHVYVEPAPLPSLPGVPSQVTELVNDCLRKEPAERPTAIRAATTLSRAADATPPAAAATPSSAFTPFVAATPAAGAPRRKRLLVAGGAAAVIAVAVLLGSFLPTGARNDLRVGIEAEPTVAGRAGTGTAPDGVVATPSRTRAAAPVQPPDGSARPTRSATTAPPPAGAAPEPGAGQPSASAAEPSAAPSAPAEPPGKTRTFTSPGGAVEARCTDGGRAQLVAWAPTEPYRVQRVKDGPALTAVIVFTRAASRIRMSVTCVAGTPTVVTLPL